MVLTAVTMPKYKEKKVKQNKSPTGFSKYKTRSQVVRENYLYDF